MISNKLPSKSNNPDKPDEPSKPDKLSLESNATQPEGTLDFSFGFSLLRPSFEIVKKNLETCIILIVVPALLITLGSLLVERTGISNAVKSAAVLILVVGLVMTIVSALATTYFELRAARGEFPTIADVYRSISTYGIRIFGLGLLVGLAILVGFLLLIVPGFIMIRRYFLAPYFLVDEDLGIREAMDRSAAVTKPVSASVYGVLLVTVLVGAVSAGIDSTLEPFGSIVGAFIGLIYVFGPALFYLHLKKQTKLEAPLPPKAPESA